MNLLKVYLIPVVLLVALIPPAYYLLATRPREQSSKPRVESNQNSTQSTEIPEEITICQLSQDPGKYNRKLVKVSGFLSHGFEESGLFDSTCDSRYSIWFEYGGSETTGTMYCCGVTAERKRPQPIVVEGFEIPLVVDDNFRNLDKGLNEPTRSDSIVHATVIGRFFSGEKTTVADGRTAWLGYGHLGCCSLMVIQQVVQVDAQDRKDLDYGATADHPDLDKYGCSNSTTLLDDTFQDHRKAQFQADNGERSWAFDDPQRVAAELLANHLQLDPSSIKLRVIRRETARVVYEWKPSKNPIYMVVVSRPYELSFHSKTEKVAWVPIAMYKACE